MTGEVHSGYWKRRRLSRRTVIRGAVLSAAALGLGGCASAAPAAPTAAPPPAAAPATGAGGAAAPSPTAQPKRGGTVRTMATTTYRNLEPHLSGGMAGTGSYGLPVCYSGLLTYKWGPDIQAPTWIPTGDLAESWTQPDDLTFVFKLRPGIKWHNIPPVNGRELVTDDIIYSYTRIRDLKAYTSLLAGISKMEAVDKSTLKLTLEKPNADILDALGQGQLMIVARERVEQTGGKLDDPPLIGTGPFILDTVELNQHAVAKRNPDYFMPGQPYVDGFELTWVTNDPSLQVSSFRGGTVNLLGPSLTVQMAEDIKKAVPSAVTYFIPNDRGGVELTLNPALDLFKDIRVRQAISKAIDRKAVIDTVWLGKGALTTGLSFPDLSYKLPEAELGPMVARDVAGAKQLLSQAGVSNLSFEITTQTALSGAFVSATEIIQANLKDIGVNTTIKPLDTAGWLTAQQTQNFQGITGTFAGAAPNGWLGARYYTGGGQNYAKYSDPAMDRMIDQQFTMVKDPEGRKKILMEIQRKIINDAIYIPVMLYYTAHAAAAEVRGFYPPAPMNTHLKLLTTVWLEK
jgi:peptide/nickel transport system substrate-binding protein